jgi:hypothetical protein
MGFLAASMAGVCAAHFASDNEEGRKKTKSLGGVSAAMLHPWWAGANISSK